MIERPKRIQEFEQPGYAYREPLLFLNIEIERQGLRLNHFHRQGRRELQAQGFLFFLKHPCLLMAGISEARQVPVDPNRPAEHIAPYRAVLEPYHCSMRGKT